MRHEGQPNAVNGGADQDLHVVHEAGIAAAMEYFVEGGLMLRVVVAAEGGRAGASAGSMTCGRASR